MSNQKKSAQIYQAALTSIMNQQGVDRKKARKIYKQMGGKLAAKPTESIEVPKNLTDFDSPEQVFDHIEAKCQQIRLEIETMQKETKELQDKLLGWEAIINVRNDS